MTSEHLKDNRRHNIITASQAWSAVYERQKLWREKTFRAKPFEGNEMTDYGLRHEEDALLQFQKYMGEICENGNKLIVHPDVPLGASADAFLDGIPVEIKCPFVQEIYPTIPDRYWVQMQIQMLCSGTQSAHFVVWTPDQFHTEIVQQDLGFLNWYFPWMDRFMSFVTKDREPPRHKRKPEFNFNKGEK